VIDIANEYFNLNKITNVDIIINDAFDYVLKTNTKFNSIIIDVFQDIVMPQFLFENYFTERICFLFELNGLIHFNTMVINKKQSTKNISKILILIYLK
jgi:spermidine synthase